MSQLDREATTAILRVSRHSAAAVHAEMAAHLNSLATVSSIAPWLGLFGTVMGIANSSVGCAGGGACLAAFAERLSGSIWTTALGLAAGLISLWCLRYLRGKLDIFDREMEGAALDLVNQLARYRGRWQVGLVGAHVGVPAIFRETAPPERVEDPRLWRRSLMLTGATLFMAWCTRVVFYFGCDLLPWSSAIPVACLYVPFVFAVAWLPTHFLWIRLLRRTRGGALVLAGVVCLAWCIAELIWRFR